MRAKKKLARPFRFQNLVLAVGLALAGCTPPGPRALLDGDRLIREGRYREAIERLWKARAHLDRDPRFWNWLGLAYQGAGQTTNAIQAYRQALNLDQRSNLVFAAHYNLGCLYLEQGETSNAVSHLRSYCELVSSSAPAWLRLGQAELRGRQLDAAERSFSKCLQVRPDDPAALNGLGLVHWQRGRLREASQYFQAAAQGSSHYGPALLNLAILYHRQPGQRVYAAQKYRQYLALEPRPSNYESVKATLLALEAELTPVNHNSTNPPPALLTRSNLAASASNGISPVTNLTKPVTNAVLGRTNPPPVAVVPQTPGVATSNAPKPATAAAPRIQAVATPAAPPSKTNTLATTPVGDTPKAASPPLPPPSATTAPPAVTVVKLPDTPAPKPAQDLPAAAPAATSPPTIGIVAAPPAPPVTTSLWVVTATPAKADKRSFLQKLNPFGGKAKSASKVSPTNSPPKAP